MKYVIYHTRPEDRREKKEEAVYDLLQTLSIPYERIDHDAAETIDDCGRIDRLFGAELCKNLFLCNAQKTAFYLLLMPGKKKFQTKVLSKQLGLPRLSFAPACFMEQFLGITPGSVSILGLMNDVEKHVTLLIDSEVVAGKYICCHPCLNTTSLKIKTENILGPFLKFTGHTYTVVNL